MFYNVDSAFPGAQGNFPGGFQDIWEDTHTLLTIPPPTPVLQAPFTGPIKYSLFLEGRPVSLPLLLYTNPVHTSFSL